MADVQAPNALGQQDLAAAAITQQTPATGSQATTQAVEPGAQDGFHGITANVDMDRTEEVEGDTIPNSASQSTQPLVNRDLVGQQDLTLTATTQTPATGSQLEPGEVGFYRDVTGEDMGRTEEVEGDAISDEQMLNPAGQRVPRDEPLPPDSDDEDNPEEDRIQAELARERIQAELATAGATGLIEGLASSAVTVPPPIIKLYQEAYGVVRAWFVTGYNQRQISRLRRVDRKIQDWNTKHRIYKGTIRQPHDDFFPTRQLHPQVRMLKDAVNKIDTLPVSSPEREEEVARLTTASYALLQLLRAKGLPWQQVIHRDYGEKFTNILAEPAARNAQIQGGLPVLETLLQPLQEQKEIMLKAKEPLIRLVREGAIDGLVKLVELNTDLRRVNEEYGIPQGDHTLPAAALLGANQQAKILLLAKAQAAGYPIAEWFPDEGDRRAITEVVEAAGLQSVTEAVQLTRSLLLIEPPSEAELQQVSLFVQDNDATVGDVNTLSSNPPTSNQTQPTDELDSSVFDRISNRRELPTGHSLLTDFGKVTHTRKAGKDRYRVFVNAGTETRPYFHVLSGSEFPSDVADEWYLTTHSETDYPPRNRRKFVARPMLIVEVPGSGSGSRQPITYYWVEFKQNPAHPEYPEKEWVTRSNFIIMVGKKQEGQWRAELQRERKKISKFYEGIKSKQLHPDTKRKLTPQDLKDMPWLAEDALPIHSSNLVTLAQPIKVRGWIEDECETEL
ncbi:hypothetical protein H2201_001559 [Coniosporium apollinis]|uniref:Uncharacterized protein n=1 Tax=Coniosporium apollinis TaxID=61459 RepID=A0ABQ9P0J9_9PEZI|nr:hypothetical protein H2201_001559 [Coniosporium apollinis]